MRLGGSVAILCCLLAVPVLISAVTRHRVDTALVLRRVDDNTILFCRRDVIGETFSLVFTHSMYGGDVTEQYVIFADHVLTRTLVTADTAGAAEYYGSYGDIVEAVGQFRLQVPPLQMPALRFIADSRGDYRLRIGGQHHRLRPASGQADHLVLTVEDLPLENDHRQPC